MDIEVDSRGIKKTGGKRPDKEVWSLRGKMEP